MSCHGPAAAPVPKLNVLWKEVRNDFNCNFFVAAWMHETQQNDTSYTLAEAISSVDAG